MKFGLCLLTFTLITNFSISQDSTESERIYYYNRDKIYFERIDHYPYSLLADESIHEPITGWLIFSSEKHIDVRHILNGVEDGYSVDFRIFKSKFRLTNGAYYKQGELIYLWTYDPSKQFIESNKFSYGLKKINNYFPSTLNNSISLKRRDIHLSEKESKIREYFYHAPSNKKSRITYKTDTPEELWDFSISDSVWRLFPFELNETKNPFSFMRFDGSYSTGMNNSDTTGLTYVVKFYAHGTAKFLALPKYNDSVVDWSTADSCSYSLKGNTVHFTGGTTETTFLNATWFTNYMIANIRPYPNGPVRRIAFYFFSDKIY